MLFFDKKKAALHLVENSFKAFSLLLITYLAQRRDLQPL